MTKKEKIALIQYLYLNDETQSFLCNDLFQEFMDIIPKNICISKENLNKETRENNYSIVKLLITIFFKENPEYKKITTKLLSNYTENKLVEHLILGYVFFLSSINKNKNVDIFKDKKSICYSEAPPLYHVII